MTIAEQALVVHAYCTAGESGAGWRAPAGRLWASFAALGEVTELVAGTPARVPAALAPGDDFTLLATGTIDRPGVYQAVLYREHDVVGLMAVLAPEGGRPWAELDAEWPAGAAGTLGTVRVYAGVCDRIVPGVVRAEFPEEQVRGPARPFDEGVAVWELAERRHDDRPPTRRLVMLTGRRREQDMYAWVWQVPGRVELRPFARYLLGAAKVRHASWVLHRSSRHRQVSRTVDDATDHLVGLIDAPAIGTAELSAGQARLAQAVGGTAGLVAALRDLSRMRISVGVATGRMTDALPRGRRFLESDAVLARVLQEQLDVDIGYLRATRESAAEVGRSARTVIGERIAGRARRLTVLQTSFLGALLMALAVIQALEYQVPLPGRLDAPLVAALAALALALPAVTERAGELDAFDRMSCALLGGAAAWLGWSALSLSRAVPPPPPLEAVLAWIAGSGITLVVLRVLVPRGKEGRP